MDLFEAIERRHSYRGAFRDEPVPREDLVRIVSAGIRAPSGCNAQTTSFVIVDDPALIREIGDAIARPGVTAAKALIVCVMEHRAVYRDMEFGVEDCAAAVENMLLAVTALGYATVWLDGALRVDGRAQRVAARLGVPPGHEVRVLLPIGRPVESLSQRERLPFEARAWFNGYRAG